MKKLILVFIALSLVFMCACSAELTHDEQFVLGGFESRVSIDGDFLIGQLNFVSAQEITLTVDYPEEIAGLEFHQNTFGIDISFAETQINEFQSELFGFNLSPVEELFEYLSSLGENNFTVDKNGNFNAETVYDTIKVRIDSNVNQIISIESENHRFDFSVN